LRWHATHQAASDLSSAFVKENFSFYGKTLRGREELPPRWKRCTNDVDNDLGEALGQAYVAKYFSPEAKQAALKIVKEIEAAMQSEIQALPWMGAATKELALTKLHAIANKIGYPDSWRDYSSLAVSYTHLDVYKRQVYPRRAMNVYPRLRIRQCCQRKINPAFQKLRRLRQEIVIGRIPRHADPKRLRQRPVIELDLHVQHLSLIHI